LSAGGRSSATGLKPLRWRLTHDTVEAADGVLHRPACGAAVGQVLEAGVVLELFVAPATCSRCWPDLAVELSGGAES
jgi:hypothetical protein